MGVRARRRRAVTALLAAVLLFVAPRAEAQHAGGAAPASSGTTAAAAQPAGEAEAAGEHKSEGAVPTLARLFNFALLVGTLVYFLRSPLANYLKNRKAQIRADLVKAQEMRAAASAQIARIEARMRALPAELEALKKSGAEEVAAEDARMREAADAERRRFLDQAGRDIDARLKLAERELVRHAAELAIAIATERVARTITAADQNRLFDRYVAQVGRSSATAS